MEIIVPNKIRPQDIISTTASTAGDPPAWTSGNTYALGAEVQVNNVIYEAVKASASGNPENDDGTNWLKIGATNVWRAFDNKIGAKVSGSDSIQYVLNRPNAMVDAVALFGLKGASALVVVTDPVDGEVFRQTVELFDHSSVSNWADYFFEEIEQLEEAIFMDIPPYVNTEVLIQVDGQEGAEIGQIVIGKRRTIGEALYGSTIGIEDYSEKDRDVFGNPQIIPRAYSYLVEYDIAYQTENAYEIRKLLANIRTTPVVWVGQRERNYGTIVLGYYRRFDIVLSEPSYSEGTIEVEGLV